MTTEIVLPAHKIGELPHYADSSMLTAWRACRRKFFWSYIHGLYPMGTSIHLVAGGAFAAGMEAVRKAVFSTPEGRYLTLDEQCEVALPVFLKEWGDFDPPSKESKSLVNTFSALKEYLVRHPPATDTLQPFIKDDGCPAVEFTFAIPLPVLHPSGEPWLFVGRFDQLGTWNNHIVVADDKTTGSIPYNWADQWGMRGQFIGYVWACQQLGIKTKTALVRGIAIQKTQFLFATHPAMYAQHMLDRWYMQLITDLEAITETYKVWRERPDMEAKLWGYNFGDSCSSYGGCAFNKLCEVKRHEPFFSNYTRHVWNPLSKTPVVEVEKETQHVLQAS